jgi:hypothetical protein
VARCAPIVGERCGVVGGGPVAGVACLLDTSTRGSDTFSASVGSVSPLTGCAVEADSFIILDKTELR